MTLSKKYKEEMDKIVMNKEMKKRILNNVLNENSQNKRKKYHLRKIYIQITAACFLTVICFSAAKNFIQQHRGLPKQISQNTNNKNLHGKEQSKNNYNKESNNGVEKSENFSENKFQQNNSGNNNLHDSKNSEFNTQTNMNNKLPDNIKNNEDRTQDAEIPNNSTKGDLNGSPISLGGNPIKEYKTIEEAEEAVKFKINTIKVVQDKFNIDTICVVSGKIIQIQYNDGKDTINFRAGKSVNDINGDCSEYEFEKSLKLNDKYIKVKGHTEGKVNLALWQIGDISYSLSAPNGIEEERISEMIKNSF